MRLQRDSQESKQNCETRDEAALGYLQPYGEHLTMDAKRLHNAP